jgi:UbiD family decarboxylase
MARQDLREVIGRQILSGHLVEVSQPVHLVHELASVAHAAEERLGVGTLFRNLSGYPDVSVLSGMFVTYAAVSDALEVELSHLTTGTTLSTETSLLDRMWISTRCPSPPTPQETQARTSQQASSPLAIRRPVA